MSDKHFDILILGGGLVGCSLACALEGRGLRIGLLEAAPAVPAGAAAFDERRLALAAASLAALDALGVLHELEPAPSPLRRIHVSRVGDFGSVLLEAADSGRESFGGVVAARALGLALERRVAALADTQVLRPATAVALGLEGERRVVTAEVGGVATTLSARLLVAADGTHSFARGALRIDAERHDYRQTLFVCGLSTERPADGAAWERFSEQGPLALLPMGRDYGAICTVASEDAARVGALDDAGFRDEFQQRFGWRAGRVLRVGRRSSHPLVRVLAERTRVERAVLVGNAAQTLHPIGAQGFNLGLRDALALAERVAGAADPGAEALLADWEAARREDRERTLAFSDGLARVTANPSPPLRALRSLGLFALGSLPGLSAPIASGAMGFRGEVPALARGRE